jgi:hypothetical protein
VHLREPAAQARDSRRFLGHLPRARGRGVGVLDGAAQVLLADVAEGDVCVVRDHHASIIGSSWTDVVRRVDEIAVLRADDRARF